MGDRKKLLVQQLGLPLISLRVPKHSVASRMHGLTAIDLINRRDTAPIDFPSSSLIAINRDSRTRTFHRGRSEFPENVRNSLQDKGVGSPGRIRTSNISVNSRTTNLIRTCGAGAKRGKSANPRQKARVRIQLS